jgi:hypothetical protein
MKKGEISQLQALVQEWIENNLSQHFNIGKKALEKKIIDLNSIDEVRESYKVLKRKDDNIELQIPFKISLDKKGR